MFSSDNEIYLHSAGELRVSFQRFGLKIPEEELSDMYDEADADGGSVTLIFTTGCVFLYQKGNSTMIYND